MTKKITTLLLTIVCLQLSTYSQLTINEVMSSNGITIADELGEFDDWIEIYNNTNEAINLAGYYISDDATDLTAYQIQASDESKTTVPSEGYGLLWADKDEVQGVNHIGIKLSGGETVILTQPDGNTIVDSLTIPVTIQEDESYGSEADGNSDLLKIFSQATPLESNSNSNDVDITFSESSKLFTNSITIGINSDGNNGELKYTTDGTDPTSSSTTYTSPITINNNTTLKVTYLFGNGDISNIETERYVKMTTGMSNANSDLPLVMIETYGQPLNEDAMKTVFMAVVETNNSGRAYGSDEASFTGKAAMKIRGASSAGFPKKQWRVELRNEDDSDRKESLLGMPADGDWVLYAPGRYDKALINNALMYEVSNQLGYYAPRTRFVEVYYNDNGGDLNDSDYWGIYILTEKIEVNKDRVDIAKLSPDENTGEDLTGGYLFSLDRDRAFETPYSNNLYGNWDVPGYRIRTPDIDDISTTQLNYIKNKVTEFENSLTSSNWLDDNLGYKNFTDIDSWVGPHIIRALAKEPDGFFLSHYIIKDKNEVIKGGPVWDFDRAMNSTDSRSQNYFGWDTDYLNNPNTGNVQYWESNYKAGAYLKEMTTDPCYKTLFYDKWFEWRSNDILNTAKLNNLIDSLANKLIESYNREFARWSSEGYTPRYGSFQGEINELKTWLKNRSEWIDGELMNKVTYSPQAGNVNAGQTISLSNPNSNGTIYYTTNGSDPKQDCSSVATAAIAYNNTISINTPGFTFIRARVKIGNQWGPLTTQGYYINQDYSGLVINEIHYNPDDELMNNEMVDGDNFEFIEIKNTSSNSINIAGIKLSSGIEAQILANTLVEPGGYFVFAENAVRFEQKYGFVPTDVYSGKLSNGGEEVILTDPFDNPIDEVDYDDQLPWDSIADEGMYSIALTDALLDNNDGSNWAIQSINTSPNAENNFCFGEDTDGNGICDENEQCPNEDGAIIGTNCDDGDLCTINDVLDANCNCIGIFEDTDNDGICDAEDTCEGDNNADEDGDGVPDACDACNNNLMGTSCDDGDACTTGETYDANCNCNGGNLVDSDNDTVCDSIDICFGDDLQDADNDGIPDDCDECPDDNTNACDLPTYCQAKGNNTYYEFIQKVSFKTINNNSGNNGGYADFSQQTATISAGESIPFSLVPGFPGIAYKEAWTIWIDFNRDGDYQDSGEKVYSNTSSGTLTGNINIPNEISAGATGMRIAMQWQNEASSCGSFIYGEVEDYTIIIGGGLAKTAEQLTNAITLYPNPASEFININTKEIETFTQTNDLNLEVYALDGELVLQQKEAWQHTIQLNIQSLPNNQPYVLHVQTQTGKVYLEKFIKL